MINDKNIIPDIECLHILSKETSKLKHIQYLIDNFHLDVDLQSVFNSYKSYKKDCPQTLQFDYLFKKYYEANKDKK